MSSLQGNIECLTIVLHPELKSFKQGSLPTLWNRTSYPCFTKIQMQTNSIRLYRVISLYHSLLEREDRKQPDIQPLASGISVEANCWRGNVGSGLLCIASRLCKAQRYIWGGTAYISDLVSLYISEDNLLTDGTRGSCTNKIIVL